jgi:hypothetical protein
MNEDHNQTVGWPGHNHIQPRIITLDKAKIFLQRFRPLIRRPAGLVRAQRSGSMIR